VSPECCSIYSRNVAPVTRVEFAQMFSTVELMFFTRDSVTLYEYTNVHRMDVLLIICFPVC
jgi:hypothetical protein